MSDVTTNTSSHQMLLAGAPRFLSRLQFLMCQEAVVVLAESGVGSTHAARATYAKSVINNPAQAAANAAPTVVGSINLNDTVVLDVDNLWNSSANDATILSQVATDWDVLAGVDIGT